MQKKNYLDYMLPVAYGLCGCMFFWKLYPYHLHFHEQFQLFLFTKSYFIETCSRPGGFSNYAGRFFTQFFLYSFVGALFISCLLTGIQQLVYVIIRRFREHPAGLFLSFLPSLFYWYLFCDENSQTGGVIALILTLLSALIGTLPKKSLTRRIYLFASIPVIYWLAGGSAILSVILLIMYEWRKLPNKIGYSVQSVVAVCFTLLLPFVVKYFFAQYPLIRYWLGVDYVHFATYLPFRIIYIWITVIIVVFGVLFLPVIRIMKTFVSWTIQILALSLCIYFIIFRGVYPQHLSNKELLAYDYYCRMQKWDEIIKMADKKSPTVPMTNACLNLALYKTGQLPDRMFDYFQNGPDGLLPNFQRDFMTPTVGGEIYWHLGFVNTAQRFAFEAMEAIPDYQKSVRSVKRLAETNLVNGYYEASSKYLHILENTLFYRNWAKETRNFLYDETRINAHPEWGKIRRLRIDKDFLFNKMERGKMLSIVFQQHADNRMAYEYLMAYTLLVKDIRSFPVFFRLKKDFKYREIPKSWQEALVYIWGLNNNNMDSIPFPVNSSIKRDATAYANIYTSMESPEPVLKKQFSKTYWYYLHFKDYSPKNTEEKLQY